MLRKIETAQIAVADRAAVAATAPQPAPRRIGGLAPVERGLLWTVALFAALYAVHAAAGLVLPILLAVLLALLLEPLVALLARCKIPAPVGAAIVVIALAGAVGALIGNIAGPAQSWFNAGPAELRKLERKVSVLARPLEAVKDATARIAQIVSGSKPQPPRTVAIEQKIPFELVKRMQEAMFNIMSTVMLVYFLLASGDLFLRKMVRIIPRLRDKIRAVEMARRIRSDIGRYFATITIFNVGLGVATGVAMELLGMPTPMLWGVAVAVLNFIPYLGPMVSTLMIAAVALITFDTALDILLPPAVFVLLNVLDDQVAQPFVLGRRFAMSPVVILVWLLFWGWLLGIGGMLIAVPSLVALRICAENIPAMAPIAEMIARD